MNEQTQELIRYRLDRSQSSLRAAKSLHSQDHYLDAINRLYYACFYAVIAALLLDNHVAKSHSGVRTMFHKHWVLTGRIAASYGKIYNEIFDMRHEDDYDDFASVQVEIADEMLTKAEDFIKTLESLINTELSNNIDQ